VSFKEPTVELRLDSRDQRDWTVLEVTGEVDLSSAPFLRARIEDLVHLGSRRLVVDLDRLFVIPPTVDEATKP
jgi:anti-sigma B factor antagonist